MSDCRFGVSPVNYPDPDPDRVWHEVLWAAMRKYNINTSIIRAIENLYDKAQNAVLFNGSTGEWFRTTVGVRQGCLLSPTLFNIFLERIICGHWMTVKVVSASEDDLLPTSACRKCRRGRRSWRTGRLSRYNHHKVQNADRPRQDKRRRSWRPGRLSRYNHHKVLNADRPRQDKSDDKQPKWLPKRDQDKRSEARRSGKLQVPWSNHLQRRIKP